MSDTLPNEVREAMKAAIDNPDVGESERLYIWYPQYRTREQTADMIIDAALSALEAAGWVCVPKEATPEMCIAAQKSELRGGGLAFFKDVWTAMLTASNPKEKPDA